MNVKELIEQEIGKGVSRRLLAKRVGVSLGTVQNILLGDTEIKNSTLAKFSAYFRRPIGQVTPAPPPPDDLLSHNVKMQDLRIAQLQAIVDGLNQKIADLGSEIGRIKDRMMDTASSGDINRLSPIRPTRN